MADVANSPCRTPGNVAVWFRCVLLSRLRMPNASRLALESRSKTTTRDKAREGEVMRASTMIALRQTTRALRCPRELLVACPRDWPQYSRHIRTAPGGSAADPSGCSARLLATCAGWRRATSVPMPVCTLPPRHSIEGDSGQRSERNGWQGHRSLRDAPAVAFASAPRLRRPGCVSIAIVRNLPSNAGCEGAIAPARSAPKPPR